MLSLNIGNDIKIWVVKMGDDFTICPECGKIDSLRNVTATYPQVWTKKQIKKFEEELFWCVECNKIVNKKDVKYQYHEGT